MANKRIETYLNDHLAGAVAAIELLEHLESAHKGTSLQIRFAELRRDISADRHELESLMVALNVDQSSLRKASAWLTEKFTQLKLRLDDPSGGPLLLLESIEVISLGIEGKRLLWRALRATSEKSYALKALDYERLIKRAEEQRDRVETIRLEAARQALAFW